ncbi:papain-like cysteine peptidase [Paenibacillus chitinolyticus]|uniref:Papain-like cysteine peptidase n=1 Tax=Paenibacillus chitinolyticus TaxID=79263 RepID=A0A410X2C5_9BACL|nr:DUF1796 family putative cysteine peptidase [Paenibacillus chitinolyticus]MCY9593595.1 papain-like cysteine peptidase [Paenibacillus chitinolyticus]MCY9597566.1 papain-like cysteine peptidase [Paenibacillus chitinolyticus]QAV20763.1 papain-like cysteine peptidase [Paenibacillus chitinolyticus]
MDLSGIAGKYDLIYSLGGNCTPSIQLKRMNLRSFSGVFDWMVSELEDVSGVLENRFQGFMEPGNLKAVGIDYGGGNLLVMDRKSRIISAHDFPQNQNHIFHLASYPEFRSRLDRRIYRTLHHLMYGSRLLFVRTNAYYEEACELERVLNVLVKQDYRVLVINHSNADGITDLQWSLPRTCAVGCYSINPACWDTLFKDVSLG